MGAFVNIQTGRANATAQVTCTNVGRTLLDAGVLIEGQAVDGALVTVEDEDIRYCLGGSVATVAGMGHILEAGDYLYLSNGYDVRSFNFCNAVGGDVATIHVTTVKAV